MIIYRVRVKINPLIRTDNKINSISKANLGMDLENDLEKTHEYYIHNNIANIHKKPTPIQVCTVTSNSKKITSAYFKNPSTTDYNGIYKGHYIDFDAKETRNETSFSLSQIAPHQIEHLRRCSEMGGICFLIVRFVYKDEYFILPFDILNKYYQDNMNDTGRSSIPYKEFATNCDKINFGLYPPLDYIKLLDKYIKKLSD